MLSKEYKEHKRIVIESVENYGYEEAKKIYIRTAIQRGVLCLLIIIAGILADIFFIHSYVVARIGFLLVIIIMPILLLKRYDKEFDAFLE